MKKPAHLGLRHLALNIVNMEACAEFYIDVLGMKLVWQPDPDNIYLSSGTDNLALHRAKIPFIQISQQHLDHLGFFLKTPQEVDEWYEYLKEKGVDIKAPPKQHRDGTCSLYCADPDGNIVQMIYYPIS